MYVVSLLMPVGIDVKDAFVQVISVETQVHLAGHSVAVASWKVNIMATTQGPRAFLTILPVKYNKCETFICETLYVSSEDSSKGRQVD